MNYFYFDIETVPIFQSEEEYFKARETLEHDEMTPKTNRSLYYKIRKGMLNPFDGKIVAITYQHNDEKLHILREWKSSECEILQEFFNCVDKATEDGWNSRNPLTYVGFNILHFDIPFLFCRMQHHKIITSWRGHELNRLFRRLYQFSIDLLQVHLPQNDYNLKGLSHDKLCNAYGLPTKNVTGKIVTDLYYKEEHEKIEEYVRKEFVYPQLFRKILNDGIVNKSKFSQVS